MAILRSGTFIAKQYLQYWLKAIDQYSLHSPFTYHFYNEVILEPFVGKEFEEIEAIRKLLLQNHTKIKVTDLGSGSVLNRNNSRPISKIASTSLSTPKFSRFLFRLLTYFQPRSVLELGTSLGINTAYMAIANPLTPVHTFEGCPNIAALAHKNFTQLGLNNIQLNVGNIDDTLPEVLAAIKSLACVFFDANHTEEATMRYFELCLSNHSEQSIFIFDDIHLSKEMHNAWTKIKSHESVTLSMDIFDAGIVFFEKGLGSKHFTLSF